jgi:hypothetical protein
LLIKGPTRKGSIALKTLNWPCAAQGTDRRGGVIDDLMMHHAARFEGPELLQNKSAFRQEAGQHQQAKQLQTRKGGPCEVPCRNLIRTCNAAMQ